MKLRLTIMYLHTKFDHKKISGSENTGRTNILDVHCELDLEDSNPVFSQLMNTYHEPKFDY